MDSKLEEKFILMLRDDIINQAEYYLNDAREFYPFGSTIDKDGKVQAISAYTGEEHPESQILIDMLEKRMKEGVSEGIYQICAIGLDVYMKNEDKKQSALEIRIIDDSGVILKFHLPYLFKDNNKVSFYDIIVTPQ